MRTPPDDVAAVGSVDWLIRPKHTMLCIVTCLATLPSDYITPLAPNRRLRLQRTSMRHSSSTGNYRKKLGWI